MSANPSIRTAIVTAVSDLHLGFSARETLRSGVLPHAYAALQGCLESTTIRAGMEAKVSTCLHAHIQFGPLPLKRQRLGPLGRSPGAANRPTGTLESTCHLRADSRLLHDEVTTLEETRLVVVLQFLRPQDYIYFSWTPSSNQQEPAARDLRQLQPPATPKHIWILLLRRVISLR